MKLSLLIQINASKIKSNHIDFVNNRSYLFQLIRLKGQIKLLRNTISMSSGTCVLVCVDMPLFSCQIFFYLALDPRQST